MHYDYSEKHLNYIKDLLITTNNVYEKVDKLRLDYFSKQLNIVVLKAGYVNFVLQRMKVGSKYIYNILSHNTRYFRDCNFDDEVFNNDFNFLTFTNIKTNTYPYLYFLIDMDKGGFYGHFGKLYNDNIREYNKHDHQEMENAVESIANNSATSCSNIQYYDPLHLYYVNEDELDNLKSRVKNSYRIYKMLDNVRLDACGFDKEPYEDCDLQVETFNFE